VIESSGQVSDAARTSILEKRVRQRSLVLIRLIEISHRIKKISLNEEKEENNRDPRAWLRIIMYLAEHTRQLKQVYFGYLSAECVIEGLKVFPYLTIVQWSQFPGDVWTKDLAELTKIPIFSNIESFDLMEASPSLQPKVTAAVVKACPNLTYLDVVGIWIATGFVDIPQFCQSLIDVSLLFEGGFPERMLNQIISNIAEYDSNIESLKIENFGHDENSHHLDLRNHAVRAALKSITHRVNYLQLDVDIDSTPGDISFAFESSTGIDLECLIIRTNNEDADMVAQILKGCRNANKIELQGQADISQVMMKISDLCNQLTDLSLTDYEGIIDGPAMRSLLQCSPMLERLYLDSYPLELKAYESLALYGGSLIQLWLYLPRSTSSTYPPSFSRDSLVFDSNFKQNRKRAMTSFITIQPLFLSVKSLAGLLSCFGKIESLSVSLPHSYTPLSIDDDELRDIPIFHAEELEFGSTEPIGEFDGLTDHSYRYDHMFLAFMGSCRSVKKLVLQTYLVQASSVVMFANMCHRRQQRLVSVSCRQGYQLQELKNLLPYIKLYPEKVFVSCGDKECLLRMTTLV
jgi:hypothetical protein